ncbi:MAG: putative ABC transporter permease [Lachnospiraceae bacterium]|nr:putative ABC transporter permease [Lachnospiraceae bacterium]
MFSGYEFLWLFLVYSFGGWIFETVYAAVKQRRFVNKGLVNLPFCVLYGLVAVFITVFGRELQGVWLYVGAVIMITVYKWTAGRIIERIFHERWWSCSERPLTIDGHVSVLDSALWGFVAVGCIKWGNGLLVKVFHWMPGILGVVLLWILVVVLGLDIIATLIVSYGNAKEKARWEEIDLSFAEITDSFGRRIYERIEKRIQKAYPQLRKVALVREPELVFAYGCGFYKLVWLFMIGSFLGDITETIYCRITAGVWMSRSSVVWGPFSIVWGLAIAMFTALLYRYKEKPDRTIFFAGTVLGGAYEYICSVFTELVFGKVFWDYSHIRFNLGGRINLLYCFFWGIAAVVWIKMLYPRISGWIERVPVRIGKVFTWLMVVFMCCNIVVSCMALVRSTQRAEGIPVTSSWQQTMDERFDDERMERIYPNAKDRF